MVDPIETIDAVGADALRLALVTGGTPGQDVALSAEKLQASRSFANKMWNTARFLTRGLQRLPPAQRQARARDGIMPACAFPAQPHARRCDRRSR